MPSRFEIRTALCALLVASCQWGPEVVATKRVPDQTNDASFPPLMLVSQCNAGTYNGTFSTRDPSDGGTSPIAVDGDFSFKLKLVNNIEFLTLANDLPLNGQSPAGRFQATLNSGKSCISGKLNWPIDNGEFLPRGGTTPTSFSGFVKGTYAPDAGTFGGIWKTEFATSPPLHLEGTWSANHSASQ